MGKQGKKKGGKKDIPSTSAPPVEGEDAGPSAVPAASQKKNERKEKKEKAMLALQALQASKKPSIPSSDSTSEVASRSESEAPTEPPSRAQSEAPSEPSAITPSEEKFESREAQKEPVKAKIEQKVEEVEEEFEGLGLTGSKKKRPRKKKADVQSIETVAKQSPAPSAQVVTPGASAQTVSPGSVPIPVLGSAPSPAVGSAQGPALVSPLGPIPTFAPGPALGPPPGLALGPPPGLAQGPPPGPQFVPATASAPATTTMSAPALSEPVKTAPSRPSGRGASHSAGRGRGWRPLEALPTPQPGPSTFSSTSSFSKPIPTQQGSSKIQVTQEKKPQPEKRSLEPVLCRYKIPHKIPGNSVPARSVILLVNYLQMEFKSLQIYRYDVSFIPDRPKKLLTQAFNKAKKEHFPNELIAFDQMKNCYSLNQLKKIKPGERYNMNVTIEIVEQQGRQMSFEMSMKATGVVDLGNIKRYMTTRSSSLCHPTEEIQCIDVILRQGALESYVKAGRQFFLRPARPIDLGYGYEMWTGLFQSAIFTDKAFINIDVAHKGFPKHMDLIEILVKDFGLDPHRPVDNQRGGDAFANFVKGLRVLATLVGNSPNAGQRREFVCNVMVDPPSRITFPLTDTDGRTRHVTVHDYYTRERNYSFKFPNLNCLWVGSRDRCIYFPIEMLTVVYGQAMARQLNEAQVAKMVKEAATPPDERLRKITEVISSMQYSRNPEFKRFGMEIADRFYEVKAKVLDPPVLDIGEGRTTIPRKGQWQANQLLKPEPLLSWGLLAVDCDPRTEYENLISLIIRTGKQMGMRVSEPKIVNVSAKMKSLHSLLLNAYSEVKFVFIIISARGRDDYHKVKQMAEREVGILTQCIKEMTARRMNPMTAKNILLKVNSKLMGINQALEINAMPKCLREGGVMIVGADVTHPSPDQTNIPSIAAVTASMDARCYTYNIELSIQTPKKEMIVEFEDMMFDHLRCYKDRNSNKLPKKIYVFRDGVSEGQFAQVMNSELQAVHDAYLRMAGQNNKPEVLFLLVQKRHHTRLFNRGRSASYNVEPGTVVDSDIVHASELDFYLVSHQAIKGTARPTRYHAVCNDGKLPDDEVEQLTYYLCHLYARCMRSVSYPTPTYYAHLACLRARSLTHGERFDNRELERKPKRLHVLDKMLQFSRMFFV